MAIVAALRHATWSHIMVGFHMLRNTWALIVACSLLNPINTGLIWADWQLQQHSVNCVSSVLL